MLTLAADLVQHFAVFSHGLHEILHHILLHIGFPPVVYGFCCLQQLAANDVQVFTVLGHRFDQILLHVHSVFSSCAMNFTGCP